MTRGELRALLREELDQVTRIAPDMPRIPTLKTKPVAEPNVDSLVRPFGQQLNDLRTRTPADTMKVLIKKLQQMLQTISSSLDVTVDAPAGR